MMRPEGNDPGKETMESFTIDKLRQGERNNILEARVYRKWILSNVYDKTANLFCCILIDKQGKAIQANMDAKNVDYFNPLLKLNKPYKILHFFCEKTSNFQQTLQNPISLRFGKITTFQPLPDQEKDFPPHYFDFLPYNDLSSRVPYTDEEDKTIYPILTDYIGCARKIGDIPTERCLRKIEIEDPEGNVVEFTLWGDMARNLDKAAIERLDPPRIIAVSSCRVTKFRERLQLAPTSATHYYINPNIEEARTLHAIFKDKYSICPPLDITNQPFKNMNMERNRNRQTLQMLLNQEPKSFQSTRFTCEATILAIDEEQKWYYTTCNKCPKKTAYNSGIYDCEDHGEIEDPYHKYSFKAIVTDGTCTANFLFFSPAGDKLTGQTCRESVNNYPDTAEGNLPPPIKNTINTRKVFQIHFTPATKKGSGQFTVDDVFDMPLDIQGETSGNTVAYIPQTPTANPKKTPTETEYTPTSQTQTTPSDEDTQTITVVDKIAETTGNTFSKEKQEQNSTSLKRRLFKDDTETAKKKEFDTT